MANFIGTFNVIPSLPQNLERLRELAYNLYWTWSQDTFELFRRLDRELWDSTGHNPVMMLGKISQDRLQEVAFRQDLFRFRRDHRNDIQACDMM